MKVCAGATAATAGAPLSQGKAGNNLWGAIK